MSVQYENGYPYVMWGDNRIELETTPITEKFYLEKAEEELRETPENVEKGLRELRQLIKDDNNLKVPYDSDAFLMKFLRPCKFYVNSAFKKLQNYYKFRISYPNYTRDLMPSAVRLPYDRSVISTLSPRDQHGRRIVLLESGDRWNHHEVPLTDLFRALQVGLEAALEEERTQISGVIVIFDMKGLTLSQVMQFTPFFAKMAVEWLQECVPIRVKAIHVIHQPYIFNMLFAIFKPFFTEKLRSRIHFHGNNKDRLLAHVDKKALRKRHGGALPEPEISGPVLWEMLSHYEEQFRVANSYGYPPKK